jgi:hypothetical protein
MARIFWDTSLFIYLFEDNAEFVTARCRLSAKNEKAQGPPPDELAYRG